MSLVRLLLALLVVGVSTSPVFALTVSDLNKLYRDHYSRDFGFSWGNADFNCPSPRCAIAKAAYDLHAPKFTGNNAPDFYKFAAGLINYVDYAEAKAGRTPLADVRSKPDGHVRLYLPFFHTDQETRAGVLVHEAAHIQLGVPDHVTCDNGESCDDVFYGAYQGGAYNYEFMYYGWLARGSNYNGLNRAVAESNMRYLVNSRFRRISNEALASWFPSGQPQTQVASTNRPVFKSALANAIMGNYVNDANVTRSVYSIRSGSITLNQFFNIANNW